MNMKMAYFHNNDDNDERMRRLKREARPGQRTVMTFMASSPKWLITFTEMRPDCGLGKGRDMSLRSVAHASSSISALSVVFNAL